MKPTTLPTTEKEAIIRQLTDILAEREEIIFSYLHGSFVDGQYFRDLDVAVYVDEKCINREGAWDYEFKLASDLNDQIRRVTIDTKVFNYAPIGFQYHVTCGRLLTNRDDDLRVDVISRVWNLYFDLQPLNRRLFKDLVGVDE
ncbi:MAG: nucleotidyltransferase domain-containing protein [Candidatus Schekmanbacteria bacterium]|nr:nucleotidyltransferase domain-containing protein [Candidatus Schekmanbacteria bacterium]